MDRKVIVAKNKDEFIDEIIKTYAKKREDSYYEGGFNDGYTSGMSAAFDDIYAAMGESDYISKDALKKLEDTVLLRECEAIHNEIVYEEAMKLFIVNMLQESDK